MLIRIICVSQGDRGRRGQVGLPGPAGPRVNNTASVSSGKLMIEGEGENWVMIPLFFYRDLQECIKARTW